jgi:ribosome-associated protein
MIKFKIETEYIELIKLIKALNISESGAQAKIFVEDGIVLRNGEVELRKRAKIRPGDKIEIFDEVIVVE